MDIAIVIGYLGPGISPLLVDLKVVESAPILEISIKANLRMKLRVSEAIASSNLLKGKRNLSNRQSIL